MSEGGVNLHLNCRVLKIDYNLPKSEVILENGEKYGFDQVVVTVNIGVL